MNIIAYKKNFLHFFVTSVKVKNDAKSKTCVAGLVDN